jgi:hypothetical protein
MLALWTKGIYRSAVHRVVSPSSGGNGNGNGNGKEGGGGGGGTHRYSVPFFFDGNAEAQLRPFDGSEPVGGRVVTVEEHMLQRLGRSYRHQQQQQQQQQQQHEHENEHERHAVEQHRSAAAAAVAAAGLGLLGWLFRLLREGGFVK